MFAAWLRVWNAQEFQHTPKTPRATLYVKIYFKEVGMTLRSVGRSSRIPAGTTNILCWYWMWMHVLWSESVTWLRCCVPKKTLWYQPGSIFWTSMLSTIHIQKWQSVSACPIKNCWGFNSSGEWFLEVIGNVVLVAREWYTRYSFLHGVWGNIEQHKSGI